MAITAISRDTLTQTVSIVRIVTTSTVAQAGTTGYLLAQADVISALNNGDFEWLVTDYFVVAASDGWLLGNISSDFESIIPTVFTTSVTGLPVVVGHIAVFSSTGGNIGEDAATAINGGNLQAGLSGTAGTVSSFPSAATSGHLALAAVTNSSGDFTVTISNAAATGQSQVISIPDSGSSTANFIISKSAGTQHVTSGSLQVDAGNVSAGLSTGGTAGKFVSYSATTTVGSLQLAAIANSGNFNVIISNASHGQSSTYSIPDVGASTGQFLVKTAALVSGNFLMASGTAGVVVDSGVPATGGSLYAQVAMTAAQFNGMYAAPYLLVAAPGANSMIVVDSIALIMTYGSAAFAAGGVVAAQYDSTANGAGVIASTTEAAADFFATASTVFKLNPGAVLSPFTTCANKGLYLSNVTQAFTTGTGSAFIVKVVYHLISTVA